MICPSFHVRRRPAELTVSELPGYAFNFCGEGKGKPRSEIFGRAWKHHYMHNDHHHQYWKDYKTPGKYKPMGVPAVCELVADWFAASISYAGVWPAPGRFPWLEQQFKNVTAEMHPSTALFLQSILIYLGFEREIMKSLHGPQYSGEETFDWHAASNEIIRHSEDTETAAAFSAIMRAANSRRSGQIAAKAD